MNPGLSAATRHRQPPSYPVTTTTQVPKPTLFRGPGLQMFKAVHALFLPFGTWVLPYGTPGPGAGIVPSAPLGAPGLVSYQERAQGSHAALQKPDSIRMFKVGSTCKWAGSMAIHGKACVKQTPNGPLMSVPFASATQLQNAGSIHLETRQLQEMATNTTCV